MSDFLFARPSFLEGLARIFDFSGSLNEYNQSRTPAEADYIALKMDCRAVGLDIQNGLAQAQSLVDHGSSSSRRAARH